MNAEEHNPVRIVSDASTQDAVELLRKDEKSEVMVAPSTLVLGT